ncbi:hypothetical protein DDZ13_05490 [Coraliomargarita sinensis]|uniref:SMODS and SLOG-associating 2TM effector domain-containing protein n=1 Tax=Coraliomargarita sinensis TaxID=2174842 RepID=A0A317ZGD9_9BACT|nr:SLATT domain-containing protein [Coraliomargarita sinensis]PXA04626.1 hypothetical protein DDZ13_05490 [Coraliomargarita sinensis]
MSEIIEELKKESLRIEEDVTYSGKRHFNAASRWEGYHNKLGIPSTALSAIAGLSAFADFPTLAGIIAISTAAVTAVFTFLKTDERASKHRAVGNGYFSLKNDARIFRNIECTATSDLDQLKTRIVELSDRRNELNEQAPETSDKDFQTARDGIEGGEQEYQADKS